MARASFDTRGRKKHGGINNSEALPLEPPDIYLFITCAKILESRTCPLTPLNPFLMRGLFRPTPSFMG